MRDGCSVCHNPHGSINDKLLVAGQLLTCLRCHFEPEFNVDGSAGGRAHQGTSYLFGQGVGTACLDCHSQVHGSNLGRSLRY
jgi:predicted CXXCH cytochrome family protein